MQVKSDICRKIFFLFTLTFPFSCFPETPKHEIRALWLTTNWSLDWPATAPGGEKKQQDDLCRILDLAAETGINTIFFQARLRGDVLYASAYEPWSSVLTGQSGRAPGYDPLHFAVEACHRRNLQCHAWIVCMPAGSDRQVSRQGKKSIVRRQPQWCVKTGGEWYLDPGLPEARRYLATLAYEVVSKYPVDGIHLDYIRYPERSYRFPDADSYRKYGKKNQSLREWRTENINRTVYNIYDTVKKIKPWIKISCATLGKYDTLPLYTSYGWSGMESVHQDAREWMKQGKVDFIVPMLYYNEENFYPFLYDWLQNDYGIPVVCGLGIYRMEKKEGDWELSDIIRQILAGRLLGAQGQAYYRAGHLLANTKNLTTELKENIYPFPALVPPVKRPDSIAPPETPCGVVLEIKSGNRVLSWNRAPNAETYIVYGSPVYPVDTGKPSNLLHHGVRDTACRVPANNLYGEPLFFYAVSGADRYCGESPPTTVRIPEIRLRPFR